MEGVAKACLTVCIQEDFKDDKLANSNYGKCDEPTSRNFAAGKV